MTPPDTIEVMPPLDPYTIYQPYDFTIEADHWAWLEPVDGAEFDNEAERWATLPADVFNALDGHEPFDPTTSSMKEYPTREAAVEALRRAAEFFKSFRLAAK